MKNINCTFSSGKTYLFTRQCPPEISKQKLPIQLLDNLLHFVVPVFRIPLLRRRPEENQEIFHLTVAHAGDH